MIRISISVAAFEALAATSPLGTVGYESELTPNGERLICLRGKIGGEGGIGDYIEKPKGMHRRTFERVMERVYRAEGIVDAQFALLLDRRMRRSPARTPRSPAS